jgi:hypothetical protein
MFLKISIFLIIILYLSTNNWAAVTESSCPNTSKDRERCYRCCVGDSVAQARRFDLEKNKFDSTQFCLQMKNAESGEINQEEYWSQQKKAIMSDDVAKKYCQAEQEKQAKAESPSNEDPCIKRCRKHFGVKK